MVSNSVIVNMVIRSSVIVNMVWKDQSCYPTFCSLGAESMFLFQYIINGLMNTLVYALRNTLVYGLGYRLVYRLGLTLVQKLVGYALLAR